MSYMYGPLQNLCYSNFRRNHGANKYRSQIEYTRNADDDFTTPGGATAANSGKMGILKSTGSKKFSICTYHNGRNFFTILPCKGPISLTFLPCTLSLPGCT